MKRIAIQRAIPGNLVDKKIIPSIYTMEGRNIFDQEAYRNSDLKEQIDFHVHSMAKDLIKNLPDHIKGDEQVMFVYLNMEFEIESKKNWNLK